MIDLEAFVRSRVTVLNEGGTRGYDQGVRTFDCPFCDDTKNRGWVGVTEWGAGCFNTGCDANPTLPGGAIEWARKLLGLDSRSLAWSYLDKHFSTKEVHLQPVARRADDWCRLPESSREFMLPDFEDPLPQQSLYTSFIERQWGVGLPGAIQWSLRWCESGRHARRVVIPIYYGGFLVGFQTRTIARAEPKYLTSQHGPQTDPHAECGRPANALLFNADSIRPGGDVVLVEGAGDVMGWHARRGYGADIPPAVALLGTALTPPKLDMLANAHPGRLVVALDPEPAAQVRARLYLVDLASWGLLATLGAWEGAKDAGAGASLVYDAKRHIGSSRTEILKAIRKEP